MDWVRFMKDNKVDTIKCKRVVLNQPITEEENDWIGVSSYVDSLEDAINNGAQMVAITSDFGSGKSSIVSMYKKRVERGIKHFLPVPGKRVYSINMWNSMQYDENQEGKESSIELHKSFLSQAISQAKPSQSEYITKKLSGNYGQVCVQGKSAIHTLFVVLMILSLEIVFLTNGFKEDWLQFFNINENNLRAVTWFSFFCAIVFFILTICKSDFLFSSSKSEGIRHIEEQEIINYFNKEFLYTNFGYHYIFVIEDLDRTNNSQQVNSFLQEISKYYLGTKSIKSTLHFNKVTFVINIKPEGMLNSKCESVYDKYFDFIIQLKKINIDNYDVILNGLLLRPSQHDLQLT